MLLTGLAHAGTVRQKYLGAAQRLGAVDVLKLKAFLKRAPRLSMFPVSKGCTRCALVGLSCWRIVKTPPFNADQVLNYPHRILMNGSNKLEVKLHNTRSEIRTENIHTQILGVTNGSCLFTTAVLLILSLWHLPTIIVIEDASSF